LELRIQIFGLGAALVSRHRTDTEETPMLTLVHKECGGPALDESPIGEVCAIPIDRFPFSCFTCLEEIDDESEVRLSQEMGF